jgi:hypothetical protein
MSGIKRIEYSGSFPKGFFTIPKKIYKDLDFLPEESEKYVKELFDLKMEDHKIIIYTDHENIRLAGIFQKLKIIVILDIGRVSMIWNLTRSFSRCFIRMPFF